MSGQPYLHLPCSRKMLQGCTDLGSLHHTQRPIPHHPKRRADGRCCRSGPPAPCSLPLTHTPVHLIPRCTWRQVESDLEAYALEEMQEGSLGGAFSPGSGSLSHLLYIGNAGADRHAAHYTAQLQVSVRHAALIPL